MPEEIPLSGGNASAGVVRVGATVRKPWTRHSPAVLAYQQAMADAGIDVPAPLGRDDQGRMVTEYVPGALAMDSPPLAPEELAQVGAMIRAIHDASARLDPADFDLGPALLPVEGADLICHGDLTPWNLVLGERRVFIDWDGAALGTRAWDLAYSAQAFTINDPSADPRAAGRDLASLVDGYGADAALRAELLELLPHRARAMHDMLESAHREGREPWGSMFVDFHGAHWRGVAEHIEARMPIWREALSAG